MKSRKKDGFQNSDFDEDKLKKNRIRNIELHDSIESFEEYEESNIRKMKS